jgi:hypothetical protein
MRQGMTAIKGLSGAWTDPTAFNGQLVPLTASVGPNRTHPNATGFASNIEPVYRPYVEAT